MFFDKRDVVNQEVISALSYDLSPDFALQPKFVLLHKMFGQQKNSASADVLFENDEVILYAI